MTYTPTEAAWFIQPHYNVIYYDGLLTILSSSKWGKGKALKLCTNKGGYMLVNLSCRSTYIHDIITSYFLGKKPAGMTVNHIDGDKTNNSIGNLEYLSIKDNISHAIRIGIHSCCKHRANAIAKKNKQL